MMSDKTNPADASEQPKNPANQTGEEFGSVKSQQRTDHNTKVTDTPRGSETETRNSSNQRG
jgi:hypothetical protein